ncbi:metallophosphoesterase [Sporosarcina sp. E16_8]|uniref:metallophosphoesterase n=1 Tax=Sporosarcina sp. E16_8 TaxID=2789295 RepID=UPI001A92E709|nr:metallophosphoesterase [Sporosarcina sp. E16_8]MBO0588153.1 metallophosphoesterase [Sporosarcina sp. E16_8]
MPFTTILLILLALVIYLLLCFYIGYNGWVWLKTTQFAAFKKTYIMLIVLLSMSFFIGRFWSWLPIQFIGGFWLVLFGYSLLVLPLINLAVYLLKKKWIFQFGLGTILFFVVVLIYGSYNALSPVVTTYEVAIDKPATEKELKIVVVSDLHLGKIVGEKHLERLVAEVEALRPDLILIPGDIIDDYIAPYLDKEMGKIVGKLHAPLGVYAVPGNHDYYGNDVDQLVIEMDKIGIHVLADETALVANDFYIIGRKDLAAMSRMTTTALVADLDQNKPLIMMDHQPVEFDEASDGGIDLLLSGHTHRGQLFPANLITRLIFENHYGYLKKDQLHSIVTSGFGTWGPPLRIGSRAEIVEINLKFQK